MPTGIIILGAVGFVAALAYLPQPATSFRWSKTLIKSTPLLSGAIASALSGGPLILTVALFLSMLGDFALSRPGKSAFLHGLSAFALAHIAYAVLFLGLSTQPVWAVFTIATIPAIAMLVIAISTEFWLAPFIGTLRWPVRIYIVLIGAMMLSALTLPVEYKLTTTGAALFVLSDLILSIRMFRLKDTGPYARPAGWAVWVFYIAGQALIFWGVLFSPAPPT